MTSERRRAHRVRKGSSVRYRMVGSLLVDEMRDISLSGLFLGCAEPFPLGTRVEIAFDRADSGSFVVEGTVVRVVWGGRFQGKRTSPGMAIAFASIDGDTEAALTRVIESAPQS
jgi:hypothetical protein